VINLTANKGGADFFIAGGADENKFSLSGTTLTFKATDFEARDDKTYSVEITAGRAGINGGANELTTGSEFVIIDDFKRSAGGGKSQGSSSIYIGSTESAKQKVGTLVTGKNDLAIDGVLTKPLLSK
jgi:hypothetical protein